MRHIEDEYHSMLGVLKRVNRDPKDCLISPGEITFHYNNWVVPLVNLAAGMYVNYLELAGKTWEVPKFLMRGRDEVTHEVVIGEQVHDSRNRDVFFSIKNIEHGLLWGKKSYLHLQSFRLHRGIVVAYNAKLQRTDIDQDPKHLLGYQDVKIGRNDFEDYIEGYACDPIASGFLSSEFLIFASARMAAFYLTTSSRISFVTPEGLLGPGDY